MTKERTKNKALQYFITHGLLFGSGYWGCDNPQDWDIAVSEKEWEQQVGTELGDFYYNQGEYNKDGYFRCFYIKDGPKVYNILVFFDTKELQVYKEASRIMILTPITFYQNKKDRIMLFNALKDIIRNKNRRGE